MLRVVHGRERHLHANLLEQMHRLRATVFKERLGWEVEVRDGMEMDRFDRCDPVYLIATDDVTGTIEGSVRLLPTTGPNMLRDVFPSLLPNRERVESPVVWESSRFSINPALAAAARVGRTGFVNAVTAKLLLGIAEVCRQVDVTSVVSVYDARMARIFRAVDCHAEIIGTPTKIGNVMTYAALFKTDDEMRTRLARVGGITGSVLSADNAALPAPGFATEVIPVAGKGNGVPPTAYLHRVWYDPNGIL